MLNKKVSFHLSTSFKEITKRIGFKRSSLVRSFGLYTFQTLIRKDKIDCDFKTYRFSSDKGKFEQ